MGSPGRSSSRSSFCTPWRRQSILTVHGNQLIELHSRTHAIIVLVRSIQGFIGRGNRELGGATEYFLEASSPLNVYAPLCRLHTMAVLIFSPQCQHIHLRNECGFTRLQASELLIDTEHRISSATAFSYGDAMWSGESRERSLSSHVYCGSVLLVRSV